MEFDIQHLDWKEIFEGESEETFQKYKRSLGLYIVLTEKEQDLTQIFKIDLETAMIDKLEGKINYKLNLSVKTSGNHKFLVQLCDNYGWLLQQDVIMKAKKVD